MNNFIFKGQTLNEYLDFRAQHQESQTAYTFLDNGLENEKSLDYGELHEYVRSIGATLQNLAKKGDRALLLFPPGLEFIKAYFSCLYSGIIAIPVYPPNPRKMERTLPKLLAIIKDSEPTLILTNSMILNLSEAFFKQILPTSKIKWVATDLIVKDFADNFKKPKINASDIAFLQYTSGSTSNSKGVIINHDKLINNLELIKSNFGHHSESRGVIWLPPYHDMGLIGGILQPLYSGFFVALMSPMSFLKQPFFWLQAISHYKATTSGGPNFAYELCLKKVSPEQRDQLDLSSWDLAFNGAERINYSTIERFCSYFKPSGFREETLYCCYGMAETTLIASGGEKSKKSVALNLNATALEKDITVESLNSDEVSRKIVGCGQPMKGHKIKIVHPDTLISCKPNEIGEIWISGPSVAKGYWNDKVKSEATFNAFVQDTKEGPFLRSGDLGFLKDNELFIVGRLKELIIVDGRNHYPEDIESSVAKCHPSIRPGGIVAFSIFNENIEKLIILVEIDRKYKLIDSNSNTMNKDEGNKTDFSVLQGDLFRNIRQAVSINHDMAVNDIKFLKFGTIPKTSSGKIQRFKCKDLYLNDTLIPL